MNSERDARVERRQTCKQGAGIKEWGNLCWSNIKEGEVDVRGGEEGRSRCSAGTCHAFSLPLPHQFFPSYSFTNLYFIPLLSSCCKFITFYECTTSSLLFIYIYIYNNIKTKEQ